MTAHTKEQFEEFLSQLKDTNATLSFYTDFNKVTENVAEISISLHTLNYLLGKEDLKNAVQDLWIRDPSVFNVMDILIATRKRDKKKYLDETGEIHLVHDLFQSVDGVIKFLDETGFADVLKNNEIKNLVDYVFGVEVGLDTNARKNRSGNITEFIVANMFRSKGIVFEEQLSSSKLPAVSEVLGADQKVFDFCINTSVKTYLIEVNFYSGGGSKLNETARSYTEIGPKINALDSYEFVWITDGQGWNTAKNKLEEAFMVIPSIYNLTTIQQFISIIKEND